MKRIITLFSTAALSAVMLSACGGDGKPTLANNGKKPAPVTVGGTKKLVPAKEGTPAVTIEAPAPIADKPQSAETPVAQPVHVTDTDQPLPVHNASNPDMTVAPAPVASPVVAETQPEVVVAVPVVPTPVVPTIVIPTTVVETPVVPTAPVAAPVTVAEMVEALILPVHSNDTIENPPVVIAAESMPVIPVNLEPETVQPAADHVETPAPIETPVAVITPEQPSVVPVEIKQFKYKLEGQPFLEMEVRSSLPVEPSEIDLSDGNIYLHCRDAHDKRNYPINLLSSQEYFDLMVREGELVVSNGSIELITNEPVNGTKTYQNKKYKCSAFRK